MMMYSYDCYTTPILQNFKKKQRTKGMILEITSIMRQALKGLQNSLAQYYQLLSQPLMYFYYWGDVMSTLNWLSGLIQ